MRQIPILKVTRNSLFMRDFLYTNNPTFYARSRNWTNQKYTCELRIINKEDPLSFWFRTASSFLTSFFFTFWSRKKASQEYHQVLAEKIQAIKRTKWGQLFARFTETYPELFWEFRELNDRNNTDSTSFQTLGKQVEIEMFKLEWILTEKMLKQEKGLDKVIDSFYTIVYLFFPRFSEVE